MHKHDTSGKEHSTTAGEVVCGEFRQCGSLTKAQVIQNVADKLLCLKYMVSR